MLKWIGLSFGLLLIPTHLPSLPVLATSLPHTPMVTLLYFGRDTVDSWKGLYALDILLNEFQYRGSNLKAFLFISQKTSAELSGLQQEHWLRTPLEPDVEDRMARAFGIQRFPTVVVVDAQGIVRFSAATFSPDALTAMINTYVDKPVFKAFCPVDKMWNIITDKTPTLVYKGVRYYFCDPAEHDGRRMDREFQEDPERYLQEAQVFRDNEGRRDWTARWRRALPGFQDIPSHFECPMKDSAPQQKPGRCARCGMLLEKVSI